MVEALSHYCVWLSLFATALSLWSAWSAWRQLRLYRALRRRFPLELGVMLRSLREEP